MKKKGPKTYSNIVHLNIHTIYVWKKLWIKIKWVTTYWIVTHYQTMWAQKGSNLRPPDYESGALTNWAMGPNLALNQIGWQICKKKSNYFKVRPIIYSSLQLIPPINHLPGILAPNIFWYSLSNKLSIWRFKESLLSNNP